jgi:hypothetical protein
MEKHDKIRNFNKPVKKNLKADQDYSTNFNPKRSAELIKNSDMQNLHNSLPNIKQIESQDEELILKQILFDNM